MNISKMVEDAAKVTIMTNMKSYMGFIDTKIDDLG